MGCRGEGKQRGFSPSPTSNPGERRLPTAQQGEGFSIMCVCVCERETDRQTDRGSTCVTGLSHKSGHLPAPFWLLPSVLPSATCPPGPMLQSSVAFLPRQGPTDPYGTGWAPLWSRMGFEAAPLAAQLPCLAPGQPGGASSHPFLWDVSWDVGMMGLSCGPWRGWEQQAGSSCGCPSPPLSFLPLLPTSCLCAGSSKNKPLAILSEAAALQPPAGAHFLGRV